METFKSLIHSDKLIYKEILLEKATYTGQLHHHDHDKLIYMGILLEKATYTGQLRHEDGAGSRRQV